VVALQSSIFQKIHHAFVLNLEVVHELTWPPLPCSSQPWYIPIVRCKFSYRSILQ
jgi:hypothetical protein